MHELTAGGVAKRYGAVTALGGVDLVLRPGITGLLGPNGAGKSTFMRILATVAKPSAGTLRYNGADVVADPRPLRRVLGYLPQESGVYPHLNAREFLEYIGALKQLRLRTLRPQIDELLEALDLQRVWRQPLGTLSGGNRQRVAIAQALLGRPQVLVVDEPTVGLDPEQRARFRDVLQRLASECIVLLSTHIVSDIETIADRVIIVAHGRIVADGACAAVTGPFASLEAAYLRHVSDAL